MPRASWKAWVWDMNMMGCFASFSPRHVTSQWGWVGMTLNMSLGAISVLVTQQRACLDLRMVLKLHLFLKISSFELILTASIVQFWQFSGLGSTGDSDPNNVFFPRGLDTGQPTPKTAHRFSPSSREATAKSSAPLQSCWL